MPWLAVEKDYEFEGPAGKATLHELFDGGDEAMGSTWSYLDLTALGRQEEWEDSPEGHPRPRRISGASARRVRGRLVIAHVGGFPLEELLPR